MFTGIIKGVGRILKQTEVGGDRRLTIEIGDAGLPALKPGDSVAVNGVCLTAITCDAAAMTADVSLETLSATTFGELSVGARVNLESSLRMGDSLDGHLVTGHVDGVARVVSVGQAARSVTLRIEAGAPLARYIARKGAVTVDGVSLTVNTVENATFEVNIVPHTREMTIMGEYRPGTAVNIEVDIIARYLERLALGGDETPGVNLELLRDHGYTSQE